MTSKILRWAPAAALLIAFVFLIVIAPVYWGNAAEEFDLGSAGMGPNAQHWFGTDNLGRDVLARALIASRLTLSLAVLATFFTFLVALPVGSMLAVSTGAPRTLGLRTLDALLAVPGILVAIVVATILGPGEVTVVAAVAASSIPAIVRLTFTLTSSVIEKDFVYGARLLGLSNAAVIGRHILPNVSDSLAVAAATSFAMAVVEVSALSFLGLGVQPPGYDWGLLLVEGAQAAYVNPAAAVPPALAIVLTGMFVGYFGDRVGAALNPARRRIGGASRPSKKTVGADAGAQSSATGPLDIVRKQGESDLLSARSMSVQLLQRNGGAQTLVSDLDIHVDPGEIVGILGESGCGKSLTAMAVGALLERPLAVTYGEHIVAGKDLEGLSEVQRAAHLAGSMAYVFQDPGSALNPALTIERQIVEAAMFHDHLSRREAEKRAKEKLLLVGLVPDNALMSRYPHQLSGGMKQRVMIAMALMTDPKLIIADEPTTALDVTIQAQVLQEIKSINATLGTSIILITHDLGVLGEVCDRVIVMYAGRVVEEATIQQLVEGGIHPYTKALLASIPTLKTNKSEKLYAIPGRPPLASETTRGCSFSPRCLRATDKCKEQRPDLSRFAGDRWAACWHPEPDPDREMAAAVAMSQ